MPNDFQDAVTSIVMWAVAAGVLVILLIVASLL
jgi:hypothetical protein